MPSKPLYRAVQTGQARRFVRGRGYRASAGPLFRPEPPLIFIRELGPRECQQHPGNVTACRLARVPTRRTGRSQSHSASGEIPWGTSAGPHGQYLARSIRTLTGSRSRIRWEPAIPASPPFRVAPDLPTLIFHVGIATCAAESSSEPNAACVRVLCESRG
jgi:hypothetical protein